MRTRPKKTVARERGPERHDPDEEGEREGWGPRERVHVRTLRTRSGKPWTYRVFISHRYARSEEYRRLVRLLDRAAEHDPHWRWENLSIPREAPIMTEEQARQGETYERKIRERVRGADVVLFIDRGDWVDNFDSVYLELAEGMWRRNRPDVPIISVLPRRFRTRSSWRRGPSVVAVRWHPRSIVRAIRRHALPASASYERLRLRRPRFARPERIVWLSPEESAERRRIANALRAHAGSRQETAAALAMSTSTLRRKAAAYLLQIR